MNRLPAWANRAAAVAVLVLLVAGLALGAVLPAVNSYQQARAELADAREMLARYRAVAEHGEAMRAAVDRLQKAQADSDLFVRGESDSLAAANLQQHLKSMVNEAGGNTQSVQSLSPQARDGLTRIGMRLKISATVRGLAEILERVETQRPLLFVRNLRVSGSLRQTDEGRPKMQPKLLVALTVAGFRLGGTS
ncbi:general secretion pathway protein M [Limimonas halophila]|uniref:General secretion pathway protein M n=1 Tax=Limimonas halophila TaxID=1082479 RepID=A0A1G7UW91_9PROT|nr:type II secretion system protein GspM [Limimonas halophila]SDG51000.1 general secretion pathway protein M [Limimonas halophila]